MFSIGGVQQEVRSKKTEKAAFIPGPMPGLAQTKTKEQESWKCTET
nr:MAG TPA: hypothetical protein [Caudoviricetes sp.]DAN32475.1 MAG TPA: hypothetical protein [Caudoviricetes sp.]